MSFHLVPAGTARALHVGNPSCILTIAAIAAMLGTAAAHASCADPRAAASAAAQFHVNLPALADTTEFRGRPPSRKIVGTWFVSYFSGGNPAGQAYIQWHGDGTEWENINFPVENGNICMGSWKQVGVNHFARNHYGWLFANGALTGYFNETETTDVTDDARYTGATHTTIYDVNGNKLTEFSGTSSAVLIEP
jgi:hypothetical protein